MIWFYPLNKLDITGYEIFAAIWLIPVITAIPVVREVISSSYGKILLEMGMASGIASFRMVGCLGAGKGRRYVEFHEPRNFYVTVFIRELKQ